MTEVTSLNEWKEPNWTYVLKTFVNMCGKCGKRQMKFQFMENKLLEMEKTRMRMFFENDVSDDEVEEKIKINLNWKTEPAPKKLLKEHYLYMLRYAIYLWKL